MNLNASRATPSLALRLNEATQVGALTDHSRIGSVALSVVAWTDNTIVFHCKDNTSTQSHCPF